MPQPDNLPDLKPIGDAGGGAQSADAGGAGGSDWSPSPQYARPPDGRPEDLATGRTMPSPSYTIPEVTIVGQAPSKAGSSGAAVAALALGILFLALMPAPITVRRK
jgi:hypothetical protein